MDTLKKPQLSSIAKLLSTSLQARSLATHSTFQQWRATSKTKMSTPSKVHLTVNDTGIVKNKPQTQETATRTSELLQENHDVSRLLAQSNYANHN